MLEFKKDRESIILDNKKIHTTLKFVVHDSFVDVPSLNVLYQTTKNSTEEINRLGKITLESYFNYWINKKGFEMFLENMLELGFSIRQRDEKDLGKKKNSHNLELEFSY